MIITSQMTAENILNAGDDGVMAFVSWLSMTRAWRFPMHWTCSDIVQGHPRLLCNV